jgi:hypothetical protein
VPIADLLRTTIALGGRAGSAELLDWATETARAIHVPVAPSVKGHEGAPTGVVATVVTRHCCRNAKRGAIFQTDGAVRLGVA